MILDLTQLLNMDNTGLETLETLHGMLQRRGGRLILCGLQEQPNWLVSQSGFADALGAGSIVPTLTEAWGRVRELEALDQKPA
jgi:SulP family sulfate permease